MGNPRGETSPRLDHIAPKHLRFPKLQELLLYNENKPQNRPQQHPDNPTAKHTHNTPTTTQPNKTTHHTTKHIHNVQTPYKTMQQPYNNVQNHAKTIESYTTNMQHHGTHRPPPMAPPQARDNYYVVFHLFSLPVLGCCFAVYSKGSIIIWHP